MTEQTTIPTGTNANDSANDSDPQAVKQPIDDAVGKLATGTTVDPDEVAFFARIADTWWDPKGPFKPLHQFSPTRLSYIRSTLCDHFNRPDTGRTPLEGLKILDIGCGGGLISEPVSRMGADILGIDASEKNVKTASHHAETTGASAKYRHITAEGLTAEGHQFDAVINMEVIEHVADVPAFLEACRKLVRPGGIMILSTINRTAKALLLAKFAAEYILGWLPKGAHDWNKFITPDELAAFAEAADFDAQSPTGMVFNPLFNKWRLSDSDLSMNYCLPVIADTDTVSNDEAATDTDQA